MSESQFYAQQLEQLIVKTLLPVYEKYCQEKNINIYDSGIPVVLLQKLHTGRPVAALLRKKDSGC